MVKFRQINNLGWDRVVIIFYFRAWRLFYVLKLSPTLRLRAVSLSCELKGFSVATEGISHLTFLRLLHRAPICILRNWAWFMTFKENRRESYLSPVAGKMLPFGASSYPAAHGTHRHPLFSAQISSSVPLMCFKTQTDNSRNTNAAASTVAPSLCMLVCSTWERK